MSLVRPLMIAAIAEPAELSVCKTQPIPQEQKGLFLRQRIY